MQDLARYKHIWAEWSEETDNSKHSSKWEGKNKSKTQTQIEVRVIRLRLLNYY